MAISINSGQYGLENGSVYPEKSIRICGGKLLRSCLKAPGSRSLIGDVYAFESKSCGQNVHWSGQPILVVTSSVGIVNDYREVAGKRNWNRIVLMRG